MKKLFTLKAIASVMFSFKEKTAKPGLKKLKLK